MHVTNKRVKFINDNIVEKTSNDKHSESCSYTRKAEIYALNQFNGMLTKPEMTWHVVTCKKYVITNTLYSYEDCENTT